MSIHHSIPLFPVYTISDTNGNFSCLFRLRVRRDVTKRNASPCSFMLRKVAGSYLHPRSATVNLYISSPKNSTPHLTDSTFSPTIYLESAE